MKESRKKKTRGSMCSAGRRKETRLVCYRALVATSHVGCWPDKFFVQSYRHGGPPTVHATHCTATLLCNASASAGHQEPAIQDLQVPVSSITLPGMGIWFCQSRKSLSSIPPSPSKSPWPARSGWPEMTLSTRNAWRELSSLSLQTFYTRWDRAVIGWFGHE